MHLKKVICDEANFVTSSYDDMINIQTEADTLFTIYTKIVNVPSCHGTDAGRQNEAELHTPRADIWYYTMGSSTSW
jgi:hypothetical protein